MSYRDRILAEDEKVIRVAHRHVIFVLLKTLPYVLLALVLWGAAFSVYYFDVRFSGVLALIFMIASLVPLGIALYRFLWWRSEEYIITNARVVQVEGIFGKRTLGTSLDKVNDVELNQPLLGRTFDFGDINILTASDVGVNDLLGIDQPFQFKKALLEAKSRYEGYGRERQSFADQVTVAAGVSERRPRRTNVEDTARVLAALSELRNSGVISEAEYQEKLQQVMTG